MDSFSRKTKNDGQNKESIFDGLANRSQHFMDVFSVRENLEKIFGGKVSPEELDKIKEAFTSGPDTEEKKRRVIEETQRKVNRDMREKVLNMHVRIADFLLRTDFKSAHDLLEKLGGNGEHDAHLFGSILEFAQGLQQKRSQFAKEYGSFIKAVELVCDKNKQLDELDKKIEEAQSLQSQRNYRKAEEAYVAVQRTLGQLQENAQYKDPAFQASLDQRALKIQLALADCWLYQAKFKAVRRALQGKPKLPDLQFFKLAWRLCELLEKSEATDSATELKTTLAVINDRLDAVDENAVFWDRLNLWEFEKPEIADKKITAFINKNHEQLSEDELAYSYEIQARVREKRGPKFSSQAAESYENILKVRVLNDSVKIRYKLTCCHYRAAQDQNSIGNVKTADKHMRKAVRHAEAALDLGGGREPHVICLCSDLYSQLKRFKKAHAIIDNAQDDLQLKQAKALVYMREDKFKQAIECLGHAIRDGKSHRGYTLFLHTRAVCYLLGFWYTQNNTYQKRPKPIGKTKFRKWLEPAIKDLQICQKKQPANQEQISDLLAKLKKKIKGFLQERQVFNLDGLDLTVPGMQFESTLFDRIFDSQKKQREKGNISELRLLKRRLKAAEFGGAANVKQLKTELRRYTKNKGKAPVTLNLSAGNLFQKHRDFDAAIDCYGKIIQDQEALLKEQSQARMNRGKAYLELAKEEQESTKQNRYKNQAAKDYLWVVLHGETKRARISRNYFYRQKADQDWGEARSNALHFYADDFFKRGEYKQAIKYCYKAIKMRQKNTMKQEDKFFYLALSYSVASSCHWRLSNIKQAWEAIGCAHTAGERYKEKITGAGKEVDEEKQNALDKIEKKHRNITLLKETPASAQERLLKIAPDVEYDFSSFFSVRTSAIDSSAINPKLPYKDPNLALEDDGVVMPNVVPRGCVKNIGKATEATQGMAVLSTDDPENVNFITFNPNLKC